MNQSLVVARFSAVQQAEAKNLFCDGKGGMLRRGEIWGGGDRGVGALAMGDHRH
jgi:hypothetical protein